MAKFKQKKAQTDELDDLFIVGAAMWLILSIYTAIVLWVWLGPREFFIVWILCGLTAISAVDTKFRKRDSEKFRLGIYVFGTAFYLVLGPATILVGVFSAFGHYIRLLAREDSVPAQDS